MLLLLFRIVMIYSQAMTRCQNAILSAFLIFYTDVMCSFGLVLNTETNVMLVDSNALFCIFVS